jgi:hypothetical protein
MIPKQHSTRQQQQQICNYIIQFICSLCCGGFASPEHDAAKSFAEVKTY